MLEDSQGSSAPGSGTGGYATSVPAHAELSFVIPAYNAADFLGEAIESVISNDLPCRYEIVVVDDASSDSTPEVVARYVKRHPATVRTARNKRNLGGGAIRNRAIELASGAVLYMLDADNVLLPNTVAPQLALLDDQTH